MRHAGLTLAVLMLVMAARPGVAQAAQSAANARAELQKFYGDLEEAFNSDQFLSDPRVALPFFDVDDMRLFDIMLPEEYRGADFRTHFIAASLDYPEKVHFVDMDIHTDGKLAIVTYIQHIVGQKKDGPAFDVRMPTTDGLEKSGGRWRIIHEHVSLPVDDATNVALLKLMPPKAEK
jgi:ketosteroid isomerase-like protein